MEQLRKESKRKGIVVVDSSRHRVFYRATQVERNVLCYGPIKVGMRVAVLENRDEFRGNPEPPLFYVALVEKIEKGLITLKYEYHPWAVRLVGGIVELAKFCVPLKRRKP